MNETQLVAVMAAILGSSRPDEEWASAWQVNPTAEARQSVARARDILAAVRKSAPDA